MAELWGYNFQFVCDIEPQLDESGTPRAFMPQSVYHNISNLPLNSYGGGPFCQFRIPSEFSQAGVYAVYVKDELTYVGECENLSKRWNFGYGNISPRNCFAGGRSTNCRVNNLILSAYKSGSKIKLFFHPTDDRFNVETVLIQKLAPLWNMKKAMEKRNLGFSLKNCHKLKRTSTRNTYENLEEYLRNSQNRVEKLTYSQIEKVLNAKLPPSAYLYRPWWANSGHSHSRAWSNANWKVAAVKLGDYVKFEKEQ